MAGHLISGAGGPTFGSFGMGGAEMNRFAFLGVAVVLAGTGLPGRAAEPAKARFAIGETVHVRFLGKDVAGRVCAFDPRSGWYSVEVAHMGRGVTNLFPGPKVFAPADLALTPGSADELEILGRTSVTSGVVRLWRDRRDRPLGSYSVYRYRKGSEHVLLQSPEGVRSLKSICDLSRDDRKYLFDLPTIPWDGGKKGVAAAKEP